MSQRSSRGSGVSSSPVARKNPPRKHYNPTDSFTLRRPLRPRETFGENAPTIFAIFNRGIHFPHPARFDDDDDDNAAGRIVTKTRTMSHHTSNSLKAYCCDRTISPAGGQISLRRLSSLSLSDSVRSSRRSLICSPSLRGPLLPFSVSISLSSSRSLLSAGRAADRRARYGRWPAKNTPLRKPYHSVERSDGTASLGGGGASAPSPRPTTHPPPSPSPSPQLGLGLFHLRASPTARETHPLRLRYDPPVSCTCARAHAREGERTLARMCVRMCPDREGCRGLGARKSKRERGTKYDPSTLPGVDAETGCFGTRDV